MYNVEEYLRKVHLMQHFRKVAVKRRARGFTQLIRYCDDYVVCFQAEREAREFAQRLRERLGRVGLKIAEEKSRIIEFGCYPYFKALREGKRTATFDFLGFTQVEADWTLSLLRNQWKHAWNSYHSINKP